ncbi:hypothetical protein BGZ94_001714, partial [Podila epigama]
MGALANLEHISRLAQLNYDPKADASPITLRVRYVSKDLWICIDIPRNTPVHHARDLILKKCQLTLAPPSAPSSLAESPLQDEEPTPTGFGNYQAQMDRHLAQTKSLGALLSGVPPERTQTNSEGKDSGSHSTNQVASTISDPDKTPTNKPAASTSTKVSTKTDIPTSQSSNSISKSLKSNNSSGSDKDPLRSLVSVDDDDRRLNAEKLVERLAMFSDCLNGVGEASSINYGRTISARPPGSTTDAPSKSSSNLKRLLSNSSASQDDNNNNPSHVSTAITEKHPQRLVNIGGWTSWRDRHHSQSGKHFQREIPALSDIMADGPTNNHPSSESMKKERESWRASFGLFWVANGHWLDDSRLLNSYNLESYDLLELQLRNHYIQLPPPGGVNYSDHYAEGVLFKLSNKSRPVSILTNHGGKESTGVWKERWVVLQGTKLLIYHKRKDTTKKTIELPIPLHLVTRPLPPDSRHQFKFTMSSAATMSSTLIALDLSQNPTAPKLYFRGASDNELSHWIRIFNSLNNDDPLRSPMLGHDGTIPPRLSDKGSSAVANGAEAYSSERKRNHTSQSLGSSAPTINFISPTLISNAMAAFSNLNNTGLSSSNNSNSASSHQYQRSFSHGGIGHHALERKDNTLQHHHLISSAKDDSRRRAITEPHLMSTRIPSKHTVKGSLTSTESVVRTLDVSNVSEAPFRLDSPPGRKRRPVLGTEYLDNASQVLLATSSARSSTAPLYSGYIWLYIPPASDSINLPTMSGSHQGHGHSQTSGRYVKCFAAINDQGHFQWVEVKKQIDLENEQESRSELAKGSSTSRSSYGIQLKSFIKSESPTTHSHSSPHTPTRTKGEGKECADDAPTHEVNSSLGPPAVTGTMAHKLRLFFFCIQISREALAQVMLEATQANSPTGSPGSQSKASPSAKARHRLSSSVSGLASSALPPLPSLKSQSLSGSISKGTSKNPTWPTMAPIQQQLQHTHDRPPLAEGYGQTLFPELPLTTSPRSESRPVSQKRSSTSLKASKDEEGLTGTPSPNSTSDIGSSSMDVVARAQILQKAAALNRQLSIMSSDDDNLQDNKPSVLSSPASSPSKARLSLGETVSAKQANIPDSASTFESTRTSPSRQHHHYYQLNQPQSFQTAGQGQPVDPFERNEDMTAELLGRCPFLESPHEAHESTEKTFITLKGYTETEEGWRILQ